MKRLHICVRWHETNGAAVIGRLIADEQSQDGDEVSFATWTSPNRLRTADEVWIHCGWLPCLWWANLWAKRAVRVPEACYDPVRLAFHGWKKRLVAPIERWCLRRCGRVLATCEAEGRWIKSYEPQAKVEVINVKRYFNLPQTPVAPLVVNRPLHVLYLGRSHPLKGVAALESACQNLGERVDLRVVCGVVGAAKEKIWDWCDVLVLPTLSDNFGLVVAEALERDKRVVVTDGAPAWEPKEGDFAYGGRLRYLRGFCSAVESLRVKMLFETLGEMCSECR